MPTFRALSQAGGTTAANITGTEPAGGAANDVYCAGVYIESDTAITPPAGWSNTFNGTTMLAECNNAGGAFRLYGYWIRRGGSAPALTWTFSSSFRALVIMAYSGALASGDPWSFGAPAVRDTAAASTYPAASGTTLDANEMLVWHAASFAGGTSSTPPTSFTERLDQGSGPGQDMCAAEHAQVAAGATGSITGASYSGTVNNTAAVLLAGLRPLASFLSARPVMVGQAVNRAGTY